MKDISSRHAEFHKPATVDTVFALHFFLHVSVAMTGFRAEAGMKPKCARDISGGLVYTWSFAKMKRTLISSKP